MSVAFRFNHNDFNVVLLAHRFDGAAHHHAVICSGLRGQVSTRHGALDRWSWAVTLHTLLAAQQRHERYQALADSLTPDQRMAVWSDDSEQARVLRRFVR